MILQSLTSEGTGHNGATESDDVALRFGVPQGLVIGPKSFIEYAEDVEGVFKKYQLHNHLSADDMQGLSSGPPSFGDHYNSIKLFHRR